MFKKIAQGAILGASIWLALFVYFHIWLILGPTLRQGIWPGFFFTTAILLCCNLGYLVNKKIGRSWSSFGEFVVYALAALGSFQLLARVVPVNTEAKLPATWLTPVGALLGLLFAMFLIVATNKREKQKPPNQTE